MKKTTYKSVIALYLLVTLCFVSFLTSCTETIDKSNFSIKKEENAADFITANEHFSMIKSIFEQTPLGNSEGASSIFNVLSTRGNYTIFLPTNEAFEKYLIDNNCNSIEDLTREQAINIAKSCVIDHMNSKAYETSEFPLKGTFDKPNLNNRLLSCRMDNESNFILNGICRIISEDNKVSNGFIHVVDYVVAPSAMTLDKLIAKADNMKIFSYLLEQTTWQDSLYKNLDLSYENPNRPLTYKLNNVAPFTWIQHRYEGYTAFVETDSVYEKTFGLKAEYGAEGELKNGNAFLEKIRPLAQRVYGAEQLDDLTHPDNAVNRFVAYHLIDGKVPYNKLVHHFNEFNYKVGDPKNPQTVNMPTNVWDFYTTMGKHRCLLKVTQVGDAGFEHDHEHTIYVNRISKYANGPEDDYRELGVLTNFEGILVTPTNGENDNNGLNGYYYPLNKLLLYSEEFRTELANRRVRVDVSTILPELASNNVRGTVYTRFDNGYFTNITREAPDTKLLYLMPTGLWGNNNYQGDEFMVSGLYDFTMKIPPVPRDGTYEIRMGVAQNPLRGMCQIYFGSDPDRLTPAGLPYDMRQAPEPNNPSFPFMLDGDDWTLNFENDKLLRNQGYMKGPQFYCITNGKADVTVRQRPGTMLGVRRIITVADMKADESYYLRFKTVLKKTDSQFYMDYIEYASPAVYNGPVAEDIW